MVDPKTENDDETTPPASEASADEPAIVGLEDTVEDGIFTAEDSRIAPERDEVTGMPIARDRRRPVEEDDEPEGRSSKAAPPLASFLRVTGFEKGDVLSFNSATRTIVTKNGGKYQVSKSGAQVRVLAGPLPPAATEE